MSRMMVNWWVMGYDECVVLLIEMSQVTSGWI